MSIQVFKVWHRVRILNIFFPNALLSNTFNVRPLNKSVNNPTSPQSNLSQRNFFHCDAELYSSLPQNRCQAPVHCDNAGPPTWIPTAVLKSARTMAPVFSISMFFRHTMATHETRYSVKIGMLSVFHMASSATCYLLVSTHEKSLDHGSGGRRESQTVRRLWPITDVLHLRTQLVKVQLCFVGASPYCYFLLFAVWSQLWGKLSLRFL